ncbi:MAG TPA: hypothetical protein VGY56_04695 [Verrucomicrobiae bacterium]|nr:hypothetical protein [Verrucomicrobiae bacterium]
MSIVVHFVLGHVEGIVTFLKFTKSPQHGAFFKAPDDGIFAAGASVRAFCGFFRSPVKISLTPIYDKLEIKAGFVAFGPFKDWNDKWIVYEVGKGLTSITSLRFN